jgi:integrase
MSVRRIKVNGVRWAYQARVGYQGQRKSSLHATRREAKDAERELLDTIKAELQQAQAEAEKPVTLRMLLEAYAQDLEHRGKGKDSVERAASTALAIERLCPELLARPVSTIDDADIFTFRKVRQASGSKPSTINRDLRTLRAALKLARPEYRFPGKAFFKEDETRVRWLRPVEEVTVLEPMAEPYRSIAKLAALTFMRLTEVRTLRREMVHLEQGVVLLPRTKDAPRAVVLSQEAQKLLRRQLESHESPWVFPNPDGHPYSRERIGRVFRLATRTAGLRDFRFHDLRHHGATMALNRGFTAPIVMALGGWKTERMMRRYAAVTDQTLRAAAEAVSGAQPVPQWESAPTHPVAAP